MILIPNHWPLATERAAKKQGIRLLRAKKYLIQRGIAACAVDSTFKYSAAPKVLRTEVMV